KKEQQTLEKILHSIFIMNPNLHYSQGFHDICSVFYIVCGEIDGKLLIESLAKKHLRDLGCENLDVYKNIMPLLFLLIYLKDKKLYNFLKKSQVHPFVGLSWILTWFSHNINRFDDICRLYDYFLSSHPLMPLYFS